MPAKDVAPAFRLPMYAEIVGEIAREEYNVQIGHEKRAGLIKQLEEFERKKPRGKTRTIILYVAKFERQPLPTDLNTEDSSVIADILSSKGKVQNIDFIIHSPGGDGNAAEQIVDMFNRYCTGELRVIVPFWAKSAATLIALCADAIVMGETSELGPIDPQIPVVSMGHLTYISVFSFLKSRDELEQKMIEASTRGLDTQPYIVQLATMNPPFLDHCNRLVQFTIDFGRKWMPKRVLRKRPNAKKRAEEIIRNFLSEDKRFQHGRMIKADEIRKDKSLGDLKIDYHKGRDVYWKKILELFVRADVFLRSGPAGEERCKLIEIKEGMHVTSAVRKP